MKNTEIFDNCIVISNNPRYTLIPNLDDDLIELFSQQEKTEDQVVLDLLSNEGDFKDFLDLIQSISKNFDAKLNKIYYIHKNEKNFIIEGNRRIIAVKLLNNDIKLPDLNNLKNINSVDDDENDDENDDSKIKKNYDEIKKIIQKREGLPKISIDDEAFEKVDNSLEVWKIVYARHISGKQIGKRSWSRSMYLLSLLNFFKDQQFEEKDFQEKIEVQLQKKYKSLEGDYFEAIWVHNIFYTYLSQNNEDKLNVNEEIKNSKVSTLQTQFCLGLFNYVLNNNYKYKGMSIFKRGQKLNEKTIFKYDYAKTLQTQKISIIKNGDWDNERFNKVIKFIFQLYKDKKITTRTNIANSFGGNDAIEAKRILFGIEGKITFENAYEFLELATVDSYEEIIKSYKNNNDFGRIKALFEEFLFIWKQIDLLISGVNKKIESLESILGPFYETFKKFIDELDSNSKNRYLHTCIYIIRSIFELLIYKAVYENNDLFDEWKITKTLRTTIDKIKDNKDNIFESPFSKEENNEFRLFNLYNHVTESLFINKENEEHLDDFISSINRNLSEKRRKEILKGIHFIDNSGTFKNLEIPIHCYHQMIDSSIVYKNVLAASTLVLNLITEILLPK